jgi:polysaccharide export outer membrane protein
MALNARIHNNDVIFIPESKSELVYVLGEVESPGAFHLTGQLTVMDALMLAGGPTEDARYSKLYMIRGSQTGQGVVKNVNLKTILEHGDLSENYLLQDNDIIFLSEKNMSKFNYVMKQLMPFLEVISLGTDNLESFGVMQELRQELWGQEGFVND